MYNIKDSRFIVSYTKNKKTVSHSKQFNSKFHLNNYLSKMKELGYTDVKVSEKGEILGIFTLSFKKEGKRKKITKKFVSKKAKECYIEALKRDNCKEITCNIEIKSVSSKEGGSFKYIPSKENEQTFYFSRSKGTTEKGAYYSQRKTLKRN